MLISKKLYSLAIICLLMLGCEHKNQQSDAPANINVEMFGTWGNNSGCSATFSRDKNQLILEHFNDGKNYSLNQIILDSKKESIMTTFKSQSPQIIFSGNFLEGVIVIDKYCSEPLHKIDN